MPRINRDSHLLLTEVVKKTASENILIEAGIVAQEAQLQSTSIYTRVRFLMPLSLSLLHCSHSSQSSEQHCSSEAAWIPLLPMAMAGAAKVAGSGGGGRTRRASGGRPMAELAWPRPPNSVAVAGSGGLVVRSGRGRGHRIRWRCERRRARGGAGAAEATGSHGGVTGG